MDKEFKNDCETWLEFLTAEKLYRVVNRPMVDLSVSLTANVIRFYSDASAGKQMGFGCILNKRWLFGKWETHFIETCEPTIEFLDLYALCAGLFTWEDQPILNNARIIVFCDNLAVMHMVNNITSSCPYCMYLLRMLVLNGLKHNHRVFVQYVNMKWNILADALSRQKLDLFKQLAPDMETFPTQIHPSLWPLSELWHKIKQHCKIT